MSPHFCRFPVPTQENDKAMPEFPMLLCSVSDVLMMMGTSVRPRTMDLLIYHSGGKKASVRGPKGKYRHYDIVLFILPLVVGIHFVELCGSLDS